MDAADNLTGFTLFRPDRRLLRAEGVTVNANNQVRQVQRILPTSSVTPWIYDAAGRVVDDGQRSYAWDAQNRLVGLRQKASGVSITYSYDGLDRRVSKTLTPSPSSSTQTSGVLGYWNKLMGLSGNSAITMRYLWCEPARIC